MRNIAARSSRSYGVRTQHAQALWGGWRIKHKVAWVAGVPEELCRRATGKWTLVMVGKKICRRCVAVTAPASGAYSVRR